MLLFAQVATKSASQPGFETSYAKPMESLYLIKKNEHAKKSYVCGVCNHYKKYIYLHIC